MKLLGTYNTKKRYRAVLICCISLFFMYCFMNNAMAEELAEVEVKASIMTRAVAKLNDVFAKTRLIIFVIGGFGLIGIAFQASFGRMRWSWFVGLAVGLAMVAAAGAIIQYAAGRKIWTPDTLTEEAVAAEASAASAPSEESISSDPNELY